MVKLRYIQDNYPNFITRNFHQTSTLKCTNVESATKLNLLRKLTLRDVYTTGL